MRGRTLCTAALVAVALSFWGCAEPDNAAELESAYRFCAKQHSRVESVHLWTGEGEGFNVTCYNGATAR